MGRGVGRMDKSEDEDKRWERRRERMDIMIEWGKEEECKKIRSGKREKYE